MLTCISDNDFISLSLDSTFQIGTPTIKGLSRQSELPAVANGFLWNSYTSLFLYGGLFSDKPVTSPVPFSMWEYDLTSSSWKEHADPQTSAGTNSEPDNIPVQRSAEGAGLSVPELGRGWYFGGHLDGYTTPGWSQSTPRVYLRSMLEFTYPGQTNEAVQSLEGGKTAGPDGVYRNITQGGIQEADGFTERADGLLVYIPGFGKEGIILGLAGGTNTTFVRQSLLSSLMRIQLTGRSSDGDEHHRYLRCCRLDVVQTSRQRRDSQDSCQPLCGRNCGARWQFLQRTHVRWTELDSLWRADPV